MRKWWPALGAAVVGAVLVAWMTAPLVTRLTSVGRLDGNDGRFSVWNVAWVDHALLTDPRHLLDANIFWPHEGTLAYSEMNLVAGVLGLPWYLATHGEPLAALNGAVATGLWLAFMCMWALVRRLTQSPGAGLVSAVAFTFCPYVSAHTPHVQLLMIFVFPLTALALHAVLDAPSLASGLWLGAALAIGAFASGYYGIFAACQVSFLALVLAGRSRRRWAALVLAAATTTTILAPAYMAFARARAASGAPQGARDFGGSWPASLSDYLASNGVAHAWWIDALLRWRPFTEVLFPGFAALILSAVAVVSIRRAGWTRRIVWAYVGLAVVACWASFGPKLYLYSVLFYIMPGMSLLRAPARFGIVVVFALAVAAGFGVTVLERRRRWVPGVLAILTACELSVYTPQWGWPSWPLVQTDPVLPAYTMLASLPRGPLVEFPFPYDRNDYHNHAHAMLWSTYHWQPLVNGYSDLVPPDFDAIAEPINGFPDPQSFDIMRARNVRYVLWGHDYVAPGIVHDTLVKRLDHYGDSLRPLLKSDDQWLYEIVRWP